MDSIKTIEEVAAILLPSIVGIVVNFLILGNYDEKTIRAIEICDKAIIDMLESELFKIINHFKTEIEKLSTLALISKDEITIQDMEVNTVTYKLAKETLQYLRNTNNIAKKLEILLFLLNSLRWLFVGLIVSFMVVSVFFISMPTNVNFGNTFLISFIIIPIRVYSTIGYVLLNTWQ